jgi:hypothetical protein
MATGDKKPAPKPRRRKVTGAAAETAATPRARENPRQKEPLINRALRDLRVIQWKSEGHTAREIAQMDGRAERTIKGILESHREHGIRGGAALLQRDPISMMEESLNRVETIYQAAFEAVLEAEGITTRLSALRMMMDAQVRKMDLLQHLNLLPRQLGTFRHVIDLWQIGEQMVDMLQAVENGEKSPEDAIRFFRGLANYGRPEIPEASVVEGGEAA